MHPLRRAGRRTNLALLVLLVAHGAAGLGLLLLVPWKSVVVQLVLDELRAGSDVLRATLDCTNGWYAEQEWRGVRLDRLLGGARGRSLDVVSATGYSRRLPLRDAPHLLLATHAARRPLSPGHGAPLRLVAPGRRGFWWVKWVARIEVVDAPWWVAPPFPLTRTAVSPARGRSGAYPGRARPRLRGSAAGGHRPALPGPRQPFRQARRTPRGVRRLRRLGTR